MGELLALALGLFLFTSPFLWWSNRNQRIELEKKFQKLKDNAASYDEMLDLRDQLNQQKASVDRERQQLNNSWDQLESLEASLQPLEDEQTLSIASGPLQFELEDSDRYKQAITDCKAEQKALIKQKRHVSGPTLTLDGDKRFHAKLLKLVLLAYNAAADDARHSIRWNNYERILTRFGKQRETINSCTPIQITPEFHRLKTREIELTYYREELRQREKEERKEIAAQLREEARVERERDSRIAAAAVAEAEAKLKSASNEQRAGYEAQLELLRQQLDDANAANTRALSMAQQTKRGHVYIISNIGSFGSDIYKVGMTRRIIPEERIKELGDASVPFPFDTHAMIECQDAPALESALHAALHQRRVNQINTRKEFFNASLAEIKSLVLQHQPEAEFMDFAEAREFRETQAYMRDGVEPDVAVSPVH